MESPDHLRAVAIVRHRDIQPEDPLGCHQGGESGRLHRSGPAATGLSVVGKRHLLEHLPVGSHENGPQVRLPPGPVQILLPQIDYQFPRFCQKVGAPRAAHEERGIRVVLCGKSDRAEKQSQGQGKSGRAGRHGSGPGRGTMEGKVQRRHSPSRAALILAGRNGRLKRSSQPGPTGKTGWQPGAPPIGGASHCRKHRTGSLPPVRTIRRLFPWRIRRRETGQSRLK